MSEKLILVEPTDLGLDIEAIEANDKGEHVIEVVIILERSTTEPEDPEDEDSVTNFLLHEWDVVDVHEAETKDRGEDADYELPSIVDAVKEEIRSIGLGAALFGGLRANLPACMTETAEKVLLRGTMTWTSAGSRSWESCYDDGGVDISFDIHEARALALKSSAPAPT